MIELLQEKILLGFKQMVAKTTKIAALDVKIARIKAGLKQYELAAKVGIAPTQLCEFERGRRELSPELLRRILQVIKGNGNAEAKK